MPETINRRNWTCPHCGGYDSGGLILHCSGCGRPATDPPPAVPAATCPFCGQIQCLHCWECGMIDCKSGTNPKPAASVPTPPAAADEVPMDLAVVSARVLGLMLIASGNDNLGDLLDDGQCDMLAELERRLADARSVPDDKVREASKLVMDQYECGDPIKDVCDPEGVLILLARHVLGRPGPEGGT